MANPTIQLTVNGRRERFDGDPEMPLLWFLRDALKLTGTIDGLAAALLQRSDYRGGAVIAEGSGDYPLLPLAMAPRLMDAPIVPSTGDPRGCGEMGIPIVAPALANAIFRACGVRLRRIPMLAELRAALGV